MFQSTNQLHIFLKYFKRNDTIPAWWLRKKPSEKYVCSSWNFTFPNWFWKKNKNHLSSCSSHHQPERKTWDLWPMRFGQQRGPRGFACDLCVPLTGWTELLRVADFLKFCGHNGWPQDGSNQVGRLCQLAGLVHQQTLISVMIYNVGPRDDSSVGEHNYSIVCVFW